MGISILTEDFEKKRDDAWRSFDPRLERWFTDNIGDPTEVQTLAWRCLRDGENVLVVSPTGSGKTLAAVLPAIDSILKGGSDRTKTSIVYITPMKALGVDILKTLTNLSDELGRIEGRKVRKWGRGRRRKDEILQDAKLQVGIRTGDVPQSERRRMLLDPPDLLVITPENLLLMLCSKARETIDSVGWIIVDEVHEMVPSKRGALLSLTMEMLTEMVKKRTDRVPVRIGLSATVKPESIAAKYMGGQNDSGEPRHVSVIKEETGKEMVIEFRTLIQSAEKDDDHREKLLDELGSMMDKDMGPLVVFHNTRKAAEGMAYSLINRGYDKVMPHHGSLGADVRKQAEDGLKKGDLKAIISSTSLELGIDIGEVETVCQIASPKDPSKMLQRFGRSGHGLGRTSHGLIYPQDGIDLLEALAVSIAASKGKLQRLKAPELPMDVLAQFAIGASLDDGGISENDLWKISRRAYPFRTLRKISMKDILELLSERLPGPNQPPPRLWYDEDLRSYLPRRNTGQAFYLNCGTIPKETSYRVIDERTRRVIGDLSRDFGETLYERDVILLGSKPYRITGFSGSKIMAHEDTDAHPTIPSWSGEVMPRPDTVASEMMTIFRKGCSRMSSSTTGIKVHLDTAGRTICSSVIKGLEDLDLLPSYSRIPVEYRKLRGSRRIYIFIMPLGRRVTETLGRVIAYGLRRSIGAKVDYVATDDGFAVISPKELSDNDIVSALGGADFEKVAKGLVLTSSIFRSRFTHCMNKSMLVLSRFRGKDTGALYKRNRVENLLGLVMDSWYSEEGWEGAVGPLKGLISLAEESLKEVLIERIDIKRCKEIVLGLSSGSIRIDLMKMSEGPSLIGRSIIRSWKGRIREIKGEEEKATDRISVDHQNGTIDPLVSLKRSTGSGQKQRIYAIDILAKAYAKTAAESGNGEGSSVVSVKEGSVTIGRCEFDRSKVLADLPIIPFFPQALPEFRRKNMNRSGDLGSVMKWVPFFTHPIELLSRSKNVSYNDIRSSMKSGRILPIHILDSDRSTDREWASIYRTLGNPLKGLKASGVHELDKARAYSRSDLGEIWGSSGEELTALITETSERKLLGRFPLTARDMLGESQTHYHPIPGQDGVNETSSVVEDGIDRFLRFFGPFDVGELIKLFGYQILEPVSKAIGSGSLKFGIGTPGPISEASEKDQNTLGLWVWSSRNEKEMLSWFEEHQNGAKDIRIQTNSDPTTILSGKWNIWVDREQVRGSVMTVLLAFKGEELIGRLNIVETIDMVRISDMEVDDYDSLEDICRVFTSWLEHYQKLGYGTFLIEKIMGIPAGEAASGAVDVFLENGFTKESTPKGELLIRGAEVIRGFSREDTLYNMFKTQGLIEGHRWSHPIEVISKLGSVVDRWEILSRLASSRYRRLSTADHGSLIEKNDLEWDTATGIEDHLDPGPQVDWTEVLSTFSVGLSDMKDLAKRFSLIRGMMDQPYPVWSLEQEFERYPPPSKGSVGSIQPRLLTLLSQISSMNPQDVGPYLKSREKNRDIEELVRHGLMIEDAWGEIRSDIISHSKGPPNDISKKTIPRGLAQTRWLLRNSRRLSVFTFEDLMNYSPGLEDPGKLRFLLNDMIGKHVKRYLTIGHGYQPLYCVNGVEPDNLERCPDPEILKELTIISPKDRMSRVVVHDIKGTIARGHGFSIFRGGRPIALISIKKLKKPVKNTDFGEGIQGSSTLEYWSVKKAWVDLRFRKKELLKSIRRAFYSLGCQLITDDEKLILESLYRDAEASKNEIS